MNVAKARTLLVADSFRVRVRDGQAEVRGFAQHLARFRGSVVEVWNQISSDEEARLDNFLAHAVSRIAAGGEAFPRLELWRNSDGETSYELSERPLPPLGSSLVARTAGHVALEAPARKGPGIGILGALNRKLGAEAVLTDEAGRVREGATTSLIYWTDESGESGLMIEDRNRVESVTELLIMDAAQRRLVGAKPNRQRTGALHLGSPTVAELQRAEVWAVNALHGIRLISSIDGVSLPDPEPTRLQWFREALDRTWEPVS